MENTSTDWRALCAELLECAKELNDLMQSVILGDYMPDSLTLQPIRIALDCARAALAQPEPEGPTDEEILNLSQEHQVSYTLCDGGVIYPLQAGADMKDDVLSFARAIIAADRARCGRSAIKPVPVSERLPGPEDCDRCGNCWWFRQATRDDFPFWWFGGGDNTSTHWLPHHALPVPTTRREER